MNELGILLILVIIFSLSLAAFRLGYTYLLVYGTFVNAISFTFGLMQTEVFGLALFVGTIIFGANFYITDLLEEYYGIKKARQYIWILLGTQIGMLTFGWFVTSYLIIGDGGTSVSVLNELLEPIYPMFAIAMISNFFLQYFDTWLYSFIHSKTGESKLWLRNNLSTITTMTIDSFIAIPIAVSVAFPEIDNQTLISLMITSAVFKYAIALFDTPFIYLSRRFKPAEIKS